jgi:hypothetical protein
MRESILKLGPLLPLILAGCALQKPSQPPTVLKTEDFIADPTTIPTQADQPSVSTSPATPLPPVVSAAAASDGVLNVTAIPGAPVDTESPKSAFHPIVIDEKVGELNGRPIRAELVLRELGPQLAAKARERTFSREEWGYLLRHEPDPGKESTQITRDQWLSYAKALIGLRLDRDLEDQLLAEEARFSLKPEQKQGLKYLVQEAAESARREAGGARAASEQAMREKGMSEREFTQSRESRMLIEYELSEKLRKRIRTSWKDVRLYYERNRAEFNPPPVAHFRRIDVPANKPDDVAAVQAALDAGTPFATVAQMEQNTYRRSAGGTTPDQTFTGDYAQASFFTGPLETAAKSLKPGEFNHAPVDVGTDKTWLFLESIERHNRSLADAETQLLIAGRLNGQAFEAERDNYIKHLKQRATFTDIPTMADELARFAGERYWPQE